MMWYCLVMGAIFFVGAEGMLSVNEIDRALTLDNQIVQLLRQYLLLHPYLPDTALDHLNYHLHQVTRYVEEFERVFMVNRSLPLTASESFLRPGEDPLLNLVLARRLSQDWPRLRDDDLDIPDWDRIVSDVELMEQTLGISVEEDTSSIVAFSLLRLQHTYPHTPYLGVAALDALEVGVMGLADGWYGASVEWLTSALQSYESQHTDVGVSERRWQSTALPEQMRVLHHIAVTAHDEKLQLEGYTNQQGMFPQPLSQKPLAKQRAIQDDSLSFGKESPQNPLVTSKDHALLSALCRGKSQQREDERSQLQCHVDTRGSAYLTLMPALVEQRNTDPEVLIFHRVLTQNQLTHLRSLAQPLLQRAQIHGKIDSLTLMKTRSSQTAWLLDGTDDLVRQVSSKIGHLTGLVVSEEQEAAEPLQVNAYLAGGHYLPHVDAILQGNNSEHKLDDKVQIAHPNGDRIATLMFYMNTVKRGGHTVFPRLGLGVEPTEGSALFWWNLLPSGSPDFRTLHSACPVEQGTKWVSNKWIKHHPQLHRHPCPLISNS